MRTSKQTLSDRLILCLVGLVLALLAYQGKTLISRVDRLERNTMQILVCLGIPPVCHNTLDSGVQNGRFGPMQEINHIKQSNRVDHTTSFFSKKP